MKLATLKIPVTDLARSQAFYSTLFGVEPVFSAEAFGWAQFDLDGLPLALYVPGKGGGAGVPGHDLDFQLAAHDLEALHDQILPLAPDAMIHTNADDSQSLELKDPDGSMLKIMAV